MVSLRHGQALFGAICGLCALVGYLAEGSLGQHFPVSVSHFFILLPAITVGPVAALLAFLIGSSPAIFLSEGNFRFTVQAAFLLGGLCIHRRWFPEIPSFFATLLTWLLLIIPCYTLTPDAAWHHSVNPYYLGIQTLIDIFLTACATTLIFTPWYSETILAKPYQIHREQLFTAVSGGLFSLVALCGVLINPMLQTIESGTASLSPNFLLILTFAALVVGIATFGARAVEFVVEELSPHKRRGRISGSFRSEELFREERRDTPLHELTFDPTEESSENRIVPPGVCALSSEGTVLFSNHRFSELIEYTGRELTSKNLFSVEMNEEIQGALQRICGKFQARADGIPCSEELKTCQLPEKLRYYSITVELHQTEEQETPGTLITLQEITDRRAIESHLLEGQKMKNLGSVIGGVAHTLNNSLTTIIGEASFGLGSSDAESLQRSLREVRTEAQKAADLIWKLLDFSEGKPTFFKELDLSELLSSQKDLLQKLVGSCFEISLQDDGDRDSWVFGDKNLLLQVVTELVTNAKDSYRENHGTIEIALGMEEMDEDIAQLHPGARPGSYHRITVSDSGTGMSNEMLLHAFAPLVSTEPRQKRTGLGLSTVYAIVRAHDGFLTIESFPEKGTKVSAYIPSTQPPSAEKGAREQEGEVKNQEVLLAPTDTRTAEESQADNQEQIRILVVEDEPDIRNVIGKMLSLLGYTVTTCGSAREASEECEHSHFDLLLVDFMMPHESGLDLIHHLQNEGHDDTAFILMSGSGNVPAFRDPSAEEQCIAKLPKPFDLEKLNLTISGALASSLLRSTGGTAVPHRNATKAGNAQLEQ
ncbi:ATP-binding protein [bacterium]|nr:ATP-binding protein [bacterium]